MASLRRKRLKHIYKFVFSFLLLSIVLTGCSSELDATDDDSKHEVQYANNAQDLSDAEQHVMLELIDQMLKKNQAFLTIDLPSPETQAASYKRALWQSRANHLQQFLRMQGLSSNQIHMRECILCSSIRVG